MNRRRQQKKPPSTPQFAQIDNFSHDGRGIARINGKATFIQGALPGEQVVFQYTRVKKDFAEGRVLEIIDPSTHRVVPLCPHYIQCGGCSLQHLSVENQIDVKQTLLIDLLQRIGHSQPETILPPLISKSWHYRHKARLSVRYVEKKHATMVGFREKNNPTYVADITQCAILHKQIDANIIKLRALIDSFTSPQVIAQVEVAAGEDKIAFIFRNLSSLTTQDEEKLRQFGQQTGFALYLQPGGVQTARLFYPPGAKEFLTYTLSAENIHFKFHPTDFTQVNFALNQLMVARALELMALEAEDTVLDLFCGLGNFSLPMARYCKQVVGFEGSEPMVKRAIMNADDNGLSNTQFYCANLEQEDALKHLANQHFSKILIDPPRSGAMALIKQINQFNPQKIVYVSCNPATLARDSDILVNQYHYHLKAVGVMDMFPHTAHVESIALFEKG